MKAEAPRWASSKAAGAFWFLLAITAALSAFFGFLIWPEMKREHLAGNERSAPATLKLLCSLQAKARAGDLDGNGIQDFWTGEVDGLIALCTAKGTPELGDQDLASTPGFLASLALADPARPGAVPFRGYWFVSLEFGEDGTAYRQSGRNFHPTAFGYCAYPARYDESGRNTFIINQENTVFSGRDGPPPGWRWPTERELKAGWYKE